MFTTRFLLLLLLYTLAVYCIVQVPIGPLPIDPLPILPVLPQWCWGGNCDCPPGYHCVFFPSPLPVTTSYPFPLPRGICVKNCPILPGPITL